MNPILFNFKFILRNKLLTIQLINVIIFHVIIGAINILLNSNKISIIEYSIVFTSGMGACLPYFTFWYIPSRYFFMKPFTKINFFQIGSVYLIIFWLINIVLFLISNLIIFKSEYYFLLSVFTLGFTSLIVIVISFFNKYSGNLNTLYNRNFNIGGITILIPIFGNRFLPGLFSKFFLSDGFFGLYNYFILVCIFLFCLLVFYYLLKVKFTVW
jgi:hypothetical protein